MTADRTRAWLPRSRWTTLHERRVAAPATTVARALCEVTAGEMRLMGTLMGLRLLPSRFMAGESARAARVGADPGRRQVEAMRDLGFVILADSPETGVVTGFVGRPWKGRLSQAVRHDIGPEDFADFDEPAHLKGAFALWAEPDGEGARVFTETRVHPTDAEAARRFRPYWSLIKPFSGVMRHDVLSAVARRAARDGAPAGRTGRGARAEGCPR